MEENLAHETSKFWRCMESFDRMISITLDTWFWTLGSNRFGNGDELAWRDRCEVRSLLNALMACHGTDLDKVAEMLVDKFVPPLARLDVPNGEHGCRLYILLQT